jgi:hypothetical protein
MIKAVDIENLLPEIQEAICKMLDFYNCERDNLEIVLPECWYLRDFISGVEVKTCCGVDIIYDYLDSKVNYIVRLKGDYNDVSKT